MSDKNSHKNSTEQEIKHIVNLRGYPVQDVFSPNPSEVSVIFGVDGDLSITKLAEDTYDVVIDSKFVDNVETVKQAINAVDYELDQNKNDVQVKIEELEERGHGTIIDYRTDDDGNILKTVWESEQGNRIVGFEHFEDLVLKTDTHTRIERPYEGWEIDELV